MFKIEFINLGRNKSNFSSCVETEPNYDVMRHLVSPYLLSAYPEFVDGVVFAGFHEVGEYQITEVQNENT